MCKLVNVWDQAGIFLTTLELNSVKSSAEAFLDSYAWLHDWAEANGRNLFHTGPLKFHTFWRSILNARFLNPKCHWTFQDEDFVGRISKLAHSVSHGVRSTKLSLKVAPKYRLLVHLRLSRLGFPAVDNLDDWTSKQNCLIGSVSARMTTSCFRFFVNAHMSRNYEIWQRHVICNKLMYKIIIKCIMFDQKLLKA
jgi:hypothetical protein